MRKIRCYDCGKSYDYDVDDFCPRCGAYTQPIRQGRLDARGDVVRVAGINEVNHKGSFVHAELHKENRRRKGTPLEVEMVKKSGSAPAIKKQTVGRPVQIAPPLGSAERSGKKKESTPASLIGAILAAALVYIIKAILD